MPDVLPIVDASGAEIVRTPDLHEASILRALGARLVSIESDGAGVAVLDLGGITLDGVVEHIGRLRCELDALTDALRAGGVTIEALRPLIDNTVLGSIAGPYGSMKTRVLSMRAPVRKR